MGIGASIRSIFGGGGEPKPPSIKKVLRPKTAEQLTRLAIRAAARTAPGLLSEGLDQRRLRLAIASLIAVPARYRSPENPEIASLVNRLNDQFWNGEYESGLSSEVSLAFLASTAADRKSSRNPARETIDFATIGLVEHLIKRADTEPDWSKIQHFEPIVETPLRADIGNVDALDGQPLWAGDHFPEGLAGDWDKIRETVRDLPAWVPCIDALRVGRPPSAENERLALDSLAAMLNDQPNTSTS